MSYVKTVRKAPILFPILLPADKIHERLIERERVRFETSVIERYVDFKPFYEQYDEKGRERLLG